MSQTKAQLVTGLSVNASAPATALNIDSSGRVLVGTSSSPSAGDGQYAKIVAQGYTGDTSGVGIISIQRGLAATSILSGYNIGRLTFNDNAGNTFAKIDCEADANAGSGDYPGRLTFSTTADGASSPTERARITNAGFFKAANTGSYFSVNGNAHELRNDISANFVAAVTHNHASNPYGINIQYTGTSPNNATNDFLYCSTTGGLFAAIRSNGGLANVQANNVNLSDARTKKDITPAANTWDCLKAWEIVNYRYTNQPDDGDLNLGVIAQQVAESCPEVITVFQQAKDATDDAPAQEERLGVKEQQMYWMAIKALQEAQIRIETLEAEVAALKGA